MKNFAHSVQSQTYHTPKHIKFSNKSLLTKHVGHVQDSAGNPVVGLDVLGDDYVGDNLAFWPTDTNGFFKIDAQTDGNYRVTVSCSQLTARGFHCVTPVAVTVSAELTELDFVVESAASAVQVANTSLPRGNVGMAYSAQLGASGGHPPYTWQLALDSANLPTGLSLNSSGLISGLPVTNSVTGIKVQVTDSNSLVTNKVLSLTINRQPVLSVPAWLTNRFSMLLTGASNQNYTIQTSTSLTSSNWTPLFVTNYPFAAAFIVTDPRATNKQQFYRVLVGP